MERVFYNPKQIFIGSAFLFLGISFYLISRPAWQITLIPDFLFVQWHCTSSFCHYLDNLPSFLHVLGFSVLTAGIITIHKKTYIIICSLWTFINILFEILQSDIFFRLGKFLPMSNQANSTLLNWAHNYSLNAVFDYYDILAILLGAICAYWLLTKTQQQGVENEHIKS